MQDQPELKEILEIARDNQRMIKVLYRKLYWQRIWSWVKLVLIAVVLLWAYWQIRPVLNKIDSIYESSKSVENYSKSKLDELKELIRLR